MTKSIDVYFSFRSPYSYLSTPELLALPDTYDVVVDLRPVLPLAVRDPGFFNPDNLKRARYIRMDWKRRAEFLGMPSHWPSPDPIVQDMTTYQIASEQPYIHRLTRLGVQAQRQGSGIRFAKEVSHLIFGTRDWDKGELLTEAANRAGLNLAAMEEAIAKGNHDEDIKANQAALDASGHWGVPTFVFEGEPFFGQDRIDTLKWRMDQNGLRKS